MLRAEPKRNRYTVGVEHCGAGRVAKSFGGDAPAEYEKARAMEAALEGTPFHVPRALHCDPGSGRIEFEFLADTTLLEELLEQAHDARRIRRVMRLNDAAAELLGLLHQRLRVPNARRWRPPDFLVERAARYGCPLSDADEVYLHCDYSPVNLMVAPDDRIAVIDASPNTYFTDFASLKGHRLVDVASYTEKLFCPFHWRTFSLPWRKLAARLRRRFVRGYERTTGVAIDQRLLALFEYAVNRCFVEWKTKRGPVRWAAMGVSHIGLFHPNFSQQAQVVD